MRAAVLALLACVACGDVIIEDGCDCDDDVQCTTPAQVCTPGVSAGCDCDVGLHGVTTCGSSGEFWGECDCGGG